MPATSFPSFRPVRSVGLTIAVTCLSALALTGCIKTTPKQPPMTQLQVRQMQTRAFPGVPERDGLRAAADALQDEGYTITQANDGLGLITGQKQVNSGNRRSGFDGFGDIGLGIALGSSGTSVGASTREDPVYVTVTQWDATVNVRLQGNDLLVRVNFVEKDLNNRGGVDSSKSITDGKTYQDFFAKMDKSLFLYTQRVR